MLEYEARHQPSLSRAAFARRLAAHFLATVLFVGVSLLGGMAGYRYLARMSWIDAYAIAAMILSGMGSTQSAENDGVPTGIVVVSNPNVVIAKAELSPVDSLPPP